MTARRKLVVVYRDYLDGTEGVTVRAPTDVDETARFVPVELLTALEAAEAAFHAAETAVEVAYNNARERKNPIYIPEESE